MAGDDDIGPEGSPPYPARVEGGMRGRPKAELVLDVEERRVLARWARRPGAARPLARRARVVLLCADGLDNKAVAAATGVAEQTVSKWRRRFVSRRLAGLGDQPRAGAPPSIGVGDVERALLTTLTQPAPQGRWTTRSLARHLGLSQSAISRIWRAFGLTPGQDAALPFADDVRDILGVFVSGRDLAIAVVAGHPDGNLGPGAVSLARRLRRAASLTTAVPGGGEATEMGEFLLSLAPFNPPDHDVHLVVSRCATRHAGALWSWLQGNARRHLHFVEGTSDFLERVDDWFARLTGTPIGRGIAPGGPRLPSFSRYLALQYDAPRLAQRNPKPPAAE